MTAKGIKVAPSVCGWCGQGVRHDLCPAGSCLCAEEGHSGLSKATAELCAAYRQPGLKADGGVLWDQLVEAIMAGGDFGQINEEG